MKVIVFDTETTGLIPKNISLYSKKDKKPYIVQLSRLVFDTAKNKLDGTYDYIVKLPDGINIPKEASTIFHKKITFHNNLLGTTASQDSF